MQNVKYQQFNFQLKVTKICRNFEKLRRSFLNKTPYIPLMILLYDRGTIYKNVRHKLPEYC